MTTTTAKDRALAIVRDRYSRPGSAMGLASDISCGYPDAIGSPGYILLSAVACRMVGHGRRYRMRRRDRRRDGRAVGSRLCRTGLAHVPVTL